MFHIILVGAVAVFFLFLVTWILAMRQARHQAREAAALEVLQHREEAEHLSAWG